MNFFEKWRKENEPEVEEQIASAKVAELEVEGEEIEGVHDPSQPQEEAPQEEKGFFSKAWEKTKEIALTPVDPYFIKMAEGLNRTRKSLIGQVRNLFSGAKRIDEELWMSLEDLLLMADVGMAATDVIIEELKSRVEEKSLTDPQALTGELKDIVEGLLSENQGSEIRRAPKGELTVWLMIGVNGAGKTTTTAKLAHQLKSEGNKVVLAAADTFRAAAVDQLERWANKVEVDLVKHKEGGDPAAVVYDALAAAKARKADYLIIDTAGRLHSKLHLMQELEKIGRIIEKDLGRAAEETFIVLDANAGQNALEQVKQFRKATPISGAILCKLDGSAKGGVILGLASTEKIPVRYIGVGEGVEDLQPFDPSGFVEALFQRD